MSLSPSSKSTGSCVCVAVLVSTASSRQSIIPSILFLHSSEWIPRPSQPGQCRVLPCFSRRRLLRYVCRDLIFVHSSFVRTSTFFSGTARDRIVGIAGITIANFQEFFAPGIAVEKLVSPLGSSVLHVVSTDMNSSFLSFVPAIIPLLHRNSSCLSSASWFSDQAIFTKGHKLFVVVFVTHISVRYLSVTHELEPIEYLPCTVTYRPTHQSVNYSNVILLLFDQLCS